MRKIGGMKLRRLLASVLALVMLLAAVPAQARGLVGWENIEVSVLWMDASGNVWQYPALAAPVDQGLSHAWWVTLPPEALNSVVTLQIIHPDPAYTYWAPDWSLNLQWFEDKNADAVDDMYTYYIGYSYNGKPQVSQTQDCMKVLLSTYEPPFEVPMDDPFMGGPVLLPEGGEGFGGQPGVDFITPGGAELIVPGGEAVPAQATVEVYYVHENGSMLDQKTLVLGEGTHTIRPESSRVSGYELVSDDRVKVTVGADGWTDVASITFYYRDAYVAPAEAEVPVYYYHENGQLLDTAWLTLPEGTHTIWPESRVVSGLELVSEQTAVVTVYANGATDVANVVFLYRDAYVAPVTGEVTVMYLLEDGTVIDNQVINVALGEQTILPESRKVDGLILTSEPSVRVYVDAGGKASPNPVQFVYRRQTTAADVVVYIYDTMGNEIAPRMHLTLAPGTHVIEAPAGSATPGYELMSEALLTVSVHADGSYSPSGDELSFWYRKAQEEQGQESILPVEPVVPEAPAQTAVVTLRYLDDRGHAIADDQTVVLDNGSHTLTPDYAHVPAGYTAIPGTESHIVAVRSGKANQSIVSFYFQKNAAAAPAVYEVIVHYYDTLGNEIAPRQTLQLGPGAHWVQADASRIPAGYKLASEAAFQLTVGENGSLDRALEDIGFWYAKQQAEAKTAVITVRYVDGSGRTIAGPYTQELKGGQSYLISPDASVIPQAYDVSGAQPVTVTISAEGYASPAVVSFVAELRTEKDTIPVGELINRYGVVNANSVAMRSEPYSTKSNTVIQRVQKGGMVYMVASEYNSAGELWTEVIVDGRTGYMKTEFISMLTLAASQAYAASVGATPVPTFTPVPTPTPTEVFVELITPVPVTPTPYAGYAVIREKTGLRTGVGSGEWTLAYLENDELVIVSEQLLSGAGESWSLVRTLDNLTGYVPDRVLRQIGEQEAAWRIQLWQQQNATPAPTTLVTNTPEPMQLQGYGLTTANNVPLRRMASEQSRIVDNLPYNTVVYITGQTYADGLAWQNVAVNGESGYIRSDLVRLMTEKEEDAYLDTFFGATETPAITPTSNPYDENGLSSFGYVTSNSVYFRSGPSTSAKALDKLNRYAMATVLGTEKSGNVTWYKINYEGVTGYIHGSYFTQMTLREFREFYGSDRYQEGLANNGDKQDEGYTGIGGQPSQEDQVLDDWYSSGNVVQPSFAPFLPVGTVEPINPSVTATPTLEPLPGYVTMATPVATQNTVPGGSGSDLPLPGETAEVVYPMQNSGSDGNALVWIVVIVLLVLAGGGALVLVQHQRKRREIALKAAQRRAQQARSSAARPYARQSAQAPRTGAYPQQNDYGQPAQLPLFPQSAQNSAPQRPYARQTGDAAASGSAASAPRVGRRTAYQQSVADKVQGGQDGTS